MPAPAFLAPLAWRAVQVGAVAALSAYAARRSAAARPPAPEDDPTDIWRERALDDVEEGVSADVTRGEDRTRVDGAGRFRRSVRLGAAGPGVEVDLSGLMRLKLRRL